MVFSNVSQLCELIFLGSFEAIHTFLPSGSGFPCNRQHNSIPILTHIHTQFLVQQEQVETNGHP
jgi:hypothetical protein